MSDIGKVCINLVVTCTVSEESPDTSFMFISISYITPCKL